MRASSCFAVQVIAFSRANARRASSNRPSARSRAAWRCQSTFWRVTSVIATDPCRCLSSAKRPPRSIEASWRSSPARINFASARFASANSSPMTRLSSMAASSTITTVPRLQVVSPFLMRNSSEWTVPARAKPPSPRRSCATAFVGASPITSCPLRSCASRIAASVKLFPVPARPSTILRPPSPTVCFEGGELVGTQRTALEGLGLRPCAHPARSRGGDLRRIRKRLPFLRAHRLRREAPDGLAGLAIMERQDLAVPEHPPLHGLSLDHVADVLGEVALEIALGEGRVIAGERRQHLVGIAGRLRVRARDLVGPPVRLGVGRPHTDRADMRLSDRASHIDADLEPLFGEVAVLQVAPDLAPRLSLAHDGAPADALDLGLEIPRLLRREPLPFHAPRRDQEMRMPVGALALRIARMRRVHVELNREALRDEVFDGEAPRELDPILRRELRVRRQRQHDLAGKLRVLAPLRRLGRIPQDRRVARASRRRLRAAAPRDAPARRGA